MSKYIIELDDRIKLVTSVGFTENGVVYTTSDYVHNLEELNSDYINEHYGELQDEAYKRGYEDGKGIIGRGCDGCRYASRWQSEEPCKSCTNCYTNRYEPIPKNDDSINVGDVVTVKCSDKHTVVVTKVSDESVWGVDADGSWNYLAIDEVTKTGKHYDIQSILEAMRK